MAKGGNRPDDDQADLLNTDARVLAYLRAAMLESGDDREAMALAIRVVEIARTKLQRNGPMRVSSNVTEMIRPTAKQSS